MPNADDQSNQKAVLDTLLEADFKIGPNSLKIDPQLQTAFNEVLVQLKSGQLSDKLMTAFDESDQEKLKQIINDVTSKTITIEIDDTKPSVAPPSASFPPPAPKNEAPAVTPNTTEPIAPTPTKPEPAPVKAEPAEPAGPSSVELLIKKGKDSLSKAGAYISSKIFPPVHEDKLIVQSNVAQREQGFFMPLHLTSYGPLEYRGTLESIKAKREGKGEYAIMRNSKYGIEGLENGPVLHKQQTGKYSSTWSVDLKNSNLAELEAKLDKTKLPNNIQDHLKAFSSDAERAKALVFADIVQNYLNNAKSPEEIAGLKFTPMFKDAKFGEAVKEMAYAMKTHYLENNDLIRDKIVISQEFEAKHGLEKGTPIQTPAPQVTPTLAAANSLTAPSSTPTSTVAEAEAGSSKKSKMSMSSQG